MRSEGELGFGEDEDGVGFVVLWVLNGEAFVHCYFFGIIRRRYFPIRFLV